MFQVSYRISADAPRYEVDVSEVDKFFSTGIGRRREDISLGYWDAWIPTEFGHIKVYRQGMPKVCR